MKLLQAVRKNKKGFTLTELIVVLVILAVLAGATIPTMLNYVNEARGRAMSAEVRSVYTAAQMRATEGFAIGRGFQTETDSKDMLKVSQLSEIPVSRIYEVDVSEFGAITRVVIVNEKGDTWAVLANNTVEIVDTAPTRTP